MTASAMNSTVKLVGSVVVAIRPPAIPPIAMPRFWVMARRANADVRAASTDVAAINAC